MMDGFLELVGALLARFYAFYALFVLFAPSVLFLNVVVLLVLLRVVYSHRPGRRPWPPFSGRVRKAGRLFIEVVFGLLNPVLYLTVLSTAMPDLARATQRWPAWSVSTLAASAWLLLIAFWLFRVFGGALDRDARAVRAGLRAIFVAALACLSAYAVKDAHMLASTSRDLWMFLGFTISLAPLYLIPAVLLADYIRGTFDGAAAMTDRSFILSGRRARASVVVAVGLALVTLLVATYRRSDTSVRGLVADHRESIRSAAAQYDVDPRLVASIVYVTHRDQLSPFRDSFERVLMGAWAVNTRNMFIVNPRDNASLNGPDMNPLLNEVLDISVGLAQIKPRTAQTASLLASGRLHEESLQIYPYINGASHGGFWNHTVNAPIPSPIPVPVGRRAITLALLNDDQNVATCALILALYQRQWEHTNREWSIRNRPDVLATLYQIGFARSKPHAAPRSNEFGRRVAEVQQQAWVREIFPTGTSGTSGTTGTSGYAERAASAIK
jgi:hypothetical protein